MIGWSSCNNPLAVAQVQGCLGSCLPCGDSGTGFSPWRPQFKGKGTVGDSHGPGLEDAYFPSLLSIGRPHETSPAGRGAVCPGGRWSRVRNHVVFSLPQTLSTYIIHICLISYKCLHGTVHYVLLIYHSKKLRDHCCYCHFTDAETQAWRGHYISSVAETYVHALRSQSQLLPLILCTVQNFENNQGPWKNRFTSEPGGPFHSQRNSVSRDSFRKVPSLYNPHGWDQENGLSHVLLVSSRIPAISSTTVP